MVAVMVAAGTRQVLHEGGSEAESRGVKVRQREYS